MPAEVDRSPATRRLRVRSLLFVPATRPDRYAKALESGADLVVIDLEDAVPADSKEQARDVVTTAIADLDFESRQRLTVRINPIGSRWFGADTSMVSSLPVRGMVVPKVSSVADVNLLRSTLAAAGGGDHTIVAGLETATGIASARTILAAGVDAAYFGAEDYIEDLGGRRTPESLEVLYARSEVVLAGRLTGVPVIDQAVLAVRDVELFRRDAEVGASFGYEGKICLHPAQVEVSHAIWTPTAPDIAHARAVLEAGASGVGVLDGQMVDEVHLNTARRVLRDAGETL